MTDPFEILDPEPDAARGLEFRARDADGVIYYAYRYPHAANAATVVVHDTARGACLLIRRDIEPYRGAYAFPGGFIEVGKESIEETAARELREETGIELAAADLKLVDVRSAPHRDPRDHVFDIGFFISVEGAEARPMDETTEVAWVAVDDLSSVTLAFDHGELWTKARSMIADA